MVGDERPSTSTTVTPRPAVIRSSSGFGGRAAAGLLADDDQDGLGRAGGVEEDLQPEVPEVDLRGGLFSASHLTVKTARRVGAECPLLPQPQQERCHHVERHTPQLPVCGP